MPLSLTVKYGKPVHIGDNIKVTPYKAGGGGVVLSIDAPKEIKILRDELKKVYCPFCTAEPNEDNKELTYCPVCNEFVAWETGEDE